MKNIITTAVVLVSLLVLHPHAQPLIAEDFESVEALSHWNPDNEGPQKQWAAITPSAAWTGTGGLRIQAGKAAMLGRGIHVPIDEALSRQGFWCSWRFRPYFKHHRQGEGFSGVGGFALPNGEQWTYTNPTLVIQTTAQERLEFSLLMRDQPSADVFEPARQKTVQLTSGVWYAIRLFARFTADSLVDSVYIDDSLYCAGAVTLKDSAGFVQDWVMGIDQPENGLLDSADFDAFSLTIGSANRPKSCTVVSPVPYEYIQGQKPIFLIRPEGGTIRISIDSAGVFFAESLLVIHGPFSLARTFFPGSEFQYRISLPDKDSVVASGFFRTSTGLRTASASLPDPQNTSLLTVGPRGNRFNQGDTVFMRFQNTSGLAWTYIDINLRSEAFGGTAVDRFGSLDTAGNIVFNIARNGDIFFKHPHGTNTWRQNDSTTSQLFPMRVLVADSVNVNPSLGNIDCAFRIEQGMRTGVWIVQAYAIADQPAAFSRFPSVYITINPGKRGLKTTMYLFITAILALVSLFFIYRSRNWKPVHKESAVLVADAVERYIKAHYSDPALNSSKIAESVRLSDRRVNSIYQEIKGKSPIQHLREVRLKEACNLLKATNLTVTEISYKVGFSDPVVFQRYFKTQLGVTPTQYRL